MSKYVKLAVLLVFGIFTTGCATTGGYENTTTGTVAGGLIGGAVAGNKGAVTGALLGAGVGLLSDHQDRKNNERADKVGKLIYNKTGGGNDSGAAQSAATAEANLAFAEKKRRECEAKYAVYQKNGVRVPHNCEAEFREALANADYVSTTNPPEALHMTIGGGYVGYGSYGGSSYGHNRNRDRKRAIRKAERQAYWACWGTGGRCAREYNRRNGY